MNNFTHATEATEVALNSMGSAQREESRYMESLEAIRTVPCSSLALQSIYAGNPLELQPPKCDSVEDWAISREDS